MANFQKVQWSRGDAVTSAKLQQMSNNDEWLKDNAIQGRLVFAQNAAGKVARGRKRGTVQAKRIEVVAYAFDSVSNVRELDVRVPFQPVWSAPPLVFPSLFIPFNKSSVRILRVGGTKYADLRITNVDNASGRISGEVQLLCIGY